MKKVFDILTGIEKEQEDAQEEINNRELSLNKYNIQKEIEKWRKWFDEEYRQQNEKATRFQNLNIEYSHYDEFRNKTYTSLNELYLEAEVVRNLIQELELEL